MDLEVGRLTTLLEMKGSDSRMSSGAGVDQQFVQDLQRKLVQSQQRENELRMNIVAYQELVQRKEEEVMMLQEQIGRIRSNSMFNNPLGGT
jgi:predicted  nucleic acid-binding Zn-ribbon protein